MIMTIRAALLSLGLLLTPSCVAIPTGFGQEPPASNLSPEQALKSFRLADDFQIEIFAAEPHVVDPVAMAFDENGRIFVVEMGDYPLGNKLGRVKLLQDTDGHGRIDKSTVFVDRLGFPNGVMPFRGGVLVTSAPDLLYFRDTNGTGKADLR